MDEVTRMESGGCSDEEMESEMTWMRLRTSGIVSESGNRVGSSECQEIRSVGGIDRRKIPRRCVRQSDSIRLYRSSCD